jgi:phosphatidylglycerol---prolipoprotein diacylglyceryl transferase
MHPVFLNVFGFEIRYYGLMYAIAFTIGMILSKREAKRKGLNEKIIEDYAFVSMISGLLGARIYYVILDLKNYAQDPMEIFAVWHGGMAIHGGIIGGIIGTFIFSKIKKVKIGELFDIAAPLLLLGQSIGRIGNLMNGDAHGVPTVTPLYVMINNNFNSWWEGAKNSISSYYELVPWGIVFPSGTPAGNEFPSTPTHPVMVYEMILNFICFLILWFYFRKKKLPNGGIGVIYLVMYSLIRSIVTIFRADDLMIGSFRAPHVISVIMIIVSILFFILNKKKARE